jgi:hypothetical protein
MMRSRQLGALINIEDIFKKCSKAVGGRISEKVKEKKNET